MASPAQPEPHATGEGLVYFKPYDEGICGWVRQALAEGERIIREDPVFPKIDMAQDYVLGDQIAAPSPSYVPKIVVNQTRKAVRAHVATLTDIGPFLAYKTYNADYQIQLNILNRMVHTWWINSMSDVELGQALKFSSVCGSGDLVFEYGPDANGVWDNRLHARDPRDTIPIRPSRSQSIQEWEGVIIREAHSINKIRSMYPGKNIMPDTGGLGEVFTRFKRILNIIVTPSTLDGLKPKRPSSGLIPEVTLYRVYLNDRSVNKTGQVVLMGDPGTNWSYLVQPGEALYPRKRLIVCTEKLVLYDGPNHYWHGQFPIIRVKLESWPWQFLGLPLISDLMPVQDALNRMVNSMLGVMELAYNRGVVADSRAMPESLLQRLDLRQPGVKAKLKATMGDGFKVIEPPNMPPWALQYIQYLFQKFDEMSETANLAQLMSLRQLPGAETIERYYQALTPGLNLEGRQMVIAIRELAEMLKVNIFQFYSKAQRMLILGDAGAALDDFDFDPDTLVPALSPQMKGYTPELDRMKPREERARWFHQMFAFYVHPKSLLAMHSQAEQLKYIQLSRQGLVDFWTLMDKLEIPNAGPPPVMPLPPIGWKPEMDPTTNAPKPPPLILRRPETITERLMAQQQLGIGQVTNSVGRKATAQAPPKVANSGQTIRESR